VDKKAEGGRLRFILLEGLGAARISDAVPPEVLSATLTACSKR
jgi:3-dehydroquinate synthase